MSKFVAMKVDNFTQKVHGILCALLMALSCTGAIQAKGGIYNSYRVEFLSSREGLPHSYVDDIYRDDKGYVWIALYGGGLCRYDGREFINFSTKTEQRLKGDFVTKCVEDRFGRLWVATTAGIDILDLSSLKVQSELPPGLPKGLFCNSMCKDARDGIWVCGLNNIYRIGFQDDGSIARVDSLAHSPWCSPTPIVCKDVEESGSVWTCINGKLHRISLAGAGGLETNPLKSSFELEEGTVATDFLSWGGEYWIASTSGLYRLDRYSDAWKRYYHSDSDPRSLAGDRIPALALSTGGKLIVGTMHGLSFYNPQGDDFDNCSSEGDDADTKMLSSDFVNCIAQVGSEIWIGTEIEGITRLLSKGLDVRDASHKTGKALSLPNAPVSSIYFDKGGRLWIGCVENGLLYKDGDSYRKITLPEIPSSAHYISAITSDTYGRLWIGTWGRGIIVKDSGGLGKTISRITSDKPYFGFITSLAYDSLGDKMWIGSRSGLFYYDFKTKELKEWAGSPQISSTEEIFIDSHSVLWVGMQNEVLRLDLRDHSTKIIGPVDGRIGSFCELEDGRMVMGSDSRGVYIVKGTDIKNISKADALSDNRIRSLVAYGNSAWIATENGLSVLQEDHIYSYSTFDGLPSERFYKNSATLGPDGQIYLGHYNGYLHISPHIRAPKAGDNILSFSSVTKDGRDHPIVYEDKLKLQEKDKDIEIHFADISFDGRHNLQYSYRLSPDYKEFARLEPWTRIIRLSRPSGGHKTLELRSTDPTSGAILASTSLELDVTPLFWKTWWFLLLCIISLVAILQGIISIRTRALRRRKAELQAEVDNQTATLQKQKKELETKTEELQKQNQQLLKQNEELASQKIFYGLDTKLERGSESDIFLGKVMDTLKGCYKDPDLDVTTFCRSIGMSYSALNAKLNEVAGESVNSFIRSYRLTVAKEILSHNTKSSSINISDVSYEVGFNDPKYFTRCFTKKFGKSPSTMWSAT